MSERSFAYVNKGAHLCGVLYPSVPTTRSDLDCVVALGVAIALWAAAGRRSLVAGAHPFRFRCPICVIEAGSRERVDRFEPIIRTMPDNSFDVVSKIDLAEVSNAIQQASKEILTRFDLKDSKSKIELNEKDNKLILASADEYKLKAVTEILQSKLVKRNVPLKGLSYGVIQPAAGSSVRQEVTLQQGITKEKASEIVKAIKDSKKKAQAAIQGDLVRVSAKDRDTLQEIIALLKGKDFGIDMQFTNYRTN